jgi:diguanylate cyclase (GGDEF)-like protein/putative nucleotidyltransferase with HDIG domain
MRDLTFNARGYLIGCYLLGLVACAGLLWAGDGLPSPDQWLLAACLAAAAGAAQLFIVSRPDSHYSDHVTPAPVFAAILLLPPPLVALVVCVAFLPEWIRYRRKWFVQTFNIASWLVAASVVLLILRRQPAFGDPSNSDWAACTLLAAMVAFVLLQTLMLGIALRLARGQSLRELGLFAPYKLLSEIALLCIGWFVAFAWQSNPIYAIPAVIPLLVVFEALNIPALRVEASTDPKTGLANIRHFNVEFDRELDRVRRNGRALSLLICDLDLLRDINNAYGHQAGDLVLRQAADTIRHGIRGCDIAARYGGEEFVIALADVDGDAARDVAERIRASFAGQEFVVVPGGRPITATLSIGIASYPEHGDSFDTLFREADLALFRAKRDGRNGVVTAGQESRELLSEWTQHRTTNVESDHLRPVGSSSQSPHGSMSVPSSNPFEMDLDLFGELYAASPPDEDSSTEADDGNSRPKPTVELLAFIWATLLLGLLMPFVIGTRHFPEAHTPWVGLILFVGLVVLAHHYAADVGGRGTTSVAVVPMIGAALLFNGLGIVAATVSFSLVAKFKAHSPLYRMLFNIGCMLLATGSADVVFRLNIHGPLARTPYHEMLIPALLAGFVFYLVNHLLLCLVRALAERRNPVEIWSEDYRWLWPHYAVSGLLGMTLGLTYEAMGAAVTIVMASPVALMHLAITQFVRRTTGYVNDLRRLNRQLGDSYESTLQALSRALDTRDAETEEHSQRVRRYTELIARRFGLPEAEIAHLSRGALLHDIGKIGVPDAILLKPDGLSAKEIEVMRKHPTIGYTMIAHIPFLAKAAEIVLHHHESFDGSGYPSGLAGEEIPLGARIFAVVDTLDAMTSDRPYRKALSFEEALAEIKRERGRQFDPKIVDTLLALSVAELVRCRDGASWEASTEPLLQKNPSLTAAPA